jgi:hypothetical protein
LTMNAVVLNCVTQFNIVWCVGTFPFLLMSKCYCVTVAESLFLKNVSTANARCSSDQCCMMTEGFKPLYPAMCVSLRHLQRCRHGAKFKSSNCFCPPLSLSLSLSLYIYIYIYIYSEGYVILSLTQLIISLVLILADRQHVSVLFKSPSSGLEVDNRYTKIPRQWDPIT